MFPQKKVKEEEIKLELKRMWGKLVFKKNFALLDWRVFFKKREMRNLNASLYVT